MARNAEQAHREPLCEILVSLSFCTTRIEAGRRSFAHVDGCQFWLVVWRDVMDRVFDWIVDRAADSIDSSSADATRPTVLDRVIQYAARGRGSWTTGLALLEKERWNAASIAFRDAAQGFEREVGHDHIWTAHALVREGWSYLKLNRPNVALPLTAEALHIVVRVKSEDRKLVGHFRDVHEAVEFAFDSSSEHHEGG